MAINPLTAQLPSSTLVDSDGNVTEVWRAFFRALQARTGGQPGTSSGDTAQQLAAEQSARIQGDQALGQAISTSQATFATALEAETAARVAADQDLAAKSADSSLGLQQEILARQAADALLVPKADLRTEWMALDLSVLPTIDPGHGMPWLDGNHIAVGQPPAQVMTLEDSTGHWRLEDGSGNWNFT